MNFEFIDKEQALDKLSENIISVENNLALVKNEVGDWILIEKNIKNQYIIDSSLKVIEREDLVTILKASANNIEEKFEDEELQQLTRNANFKSISRLIPNIESDEHRELRESLYTKKQRAMKFAKKVGKGLSEIEKSGFQGRYVAQALQHEHPFWIKEIVLNNILPELSGKEKMIIAELWLTENTDLSVTEWAKSIYQKWQNSNENIEFLRWVAQQRIKPHEITAWEYSHPGEDFNEASFLQWQTEQEDDLLGLPDWLLAELAGDKYQDPKLFDEWRNQNLKSFKQQYQIFTQIAGLNEIENNIEYFKEYLKLFTELKYSQIPIDEGSQGLWILKNILKKMGKISDFEYHAKYMLYTDEVSRTKENITFDDWNLRIEKNLHERWQNSGLQLSFEEYRTQQDDNLLSTLSAPFASLDSEQRKTYETSIIDGVLYRNRIPLNTEYEKTFEEGKGPGYAIFVISPDEKLYVASHIGGVFHHSSFLASSATRAAGDLKTDENGKIIELSNKSGHYRPSPEENLYMLNYLKNIGVDLSTVKFTEYGANGQTVYDSALERFQQLSEEFPSLISDLTTKNKPKF